MPWRVHAKSGAQFRFSSPLGKSLNTMTKMEDFPLVDTTVAPRDSPRPLKKMAMSPSSTGHGGQYDTKYSPLTRYCERHSWGGEFRVVNVNQPVREYNSAHPNVSPGVTPDILLFVLLWKVLGSGSKRYVAPLPPPQTIVDTKTSMYKGALSVQRM